MSAVLHFPSAPFDALECFPLACTLEEVLFEQAVDKVATPEYLMGWLESADHIREHSKYFACPISNEELLAIVFGRKVSDEQRSQAAILLHKRFVEEHMDEIRAVVAESKEY